MARECLRREKRWQGKGEATGGSKGLRKSELEWQGRLEGARTVEVSRGEGLQVSCSKDCPWRDYNLIACSPSLKFISLVAVVDISSEYGWNLTPSLMASSGVNNTTIALLNSSTKAGNLRRVGPVGVWCFHRRGGLHSRRWLCHPCSRGSDRFRSTLK
jgi:hypothetical protein